MASGQIRASTATRDHIETLVEYQLAMASESEGLTLDRGLLRDGIAAVLNSQDKGFYLVAEVDGEVVAGLLITYEWSDWRNGFFWWIQSVYVDSQWRRKGVYTAMHNRVLELARSDGSICGVRLYVERTNLAAKQTYEHLGMALSRYDMFEVDFGA